MMLGIETLAGEREDEKGHRSRAKIGYDVSDCGHVWENGIGIV